MPTTKIRHSRFKPPPPLDLRMQGATDSTTITLHADYTQHAWIQASGISLVDRGNTHARGSWLLEARWSNATDFDHDTAIALRMVLHGVTLHMINDGRVWIDGFIDGDDPVMFRVPAPEWNQLEGATGCEHRDCGRPGHLVVDERRYVPPPNFELFDMLRGLRVEIITWREP